MMRANITLMTEYMSLMFVTCMTRQHFYFSSLLPSPHKGIIPCGVDDILREIDEALRRHGISARAASMRAHGSPELIRDMRRGHVPSVERLRSLCEALGLEFYVGRPRGLEGEDGAGLPDVSLRSLERIARALAQLTADAGGNPIADELWHALSTRRYTGLAPDTAPRPVRYLTEQPPPAYGGEAREAPPPGLVRFDMTDGAGNRLSTAGDEDSLWMSRALLEKQGLDPARCSAARVEDDSMEPTIPKGCGVLVDRTRTDWQPPCITVVRTDERAIVRRAALDEDGQHLMSSDHPGWPDTPLPDGAEIVGQVRWVNWWAA